VNALRAGAADFVSKNSTFARTDLARIDSELRIKIRALVARNGVRSSPASAPASAPPFPLPNRIGGAPRRGVCLPAGPVDLIAIAVSTGGPAALGVLLGALTATHAPIVIAQHMPRFFTACLAESLTQDTGLSVREGEHRQRLSPDEVTILPGAWDGVVSGRNGAFELRLEQTESAVHPSGDALFASVAAVASHPVAVILTGMGEDGVRGAERFARRGLPVLVQRPDSCVVGGMPSAAIEAGVASEALTLDEIARRLRWWASPDFKPRPAETAER
jgi:two-component system chemotaxis response regulator CheB